MMVICSPCCSDGRRNDEQKTIFQQRGKWDWLDVENAEEDDDDVNILRERGREREREGEREREKRERERRERERREREREREWNLAQSKVSWVNENDID